MEYDLIIRGGSIVDGTGLKPYVADIAIAGDRIARIGRIDVEAERVFDAPDNTKAARRGAAFDLVCVVAGDGFEPPTFGL